MAFEAELRLQKLIRGNPDSKGNFGNVVEAHVPLTLLDLAKIGLADPRQPTQIALT